MKTHLRLLLAQIFLINSLSVVPAQAAWRDIFKRKPKAEVQDIQVEINKVEKNSERFVQVTIEGQKFEFTEVALAEAIDEVKKNNGPQVPPQTLKQAPQNMRNLYQFFQNYIPEMVLQVLHHNGKLTVDGVDSATLQAKQQKSTEKRAQDATAKATTNDGLEIREPLSPEAPPQGAKIEATVSVSEVDSNKDGKTETEAKVEQVKIDEATKEARSIIHEQFKPSEIRKLLAQDRRDYVKNLVRERLNEIRRKKNEYVGPEWHETTWGKQTRKFPMETIMFFISIGVINFGMLKLDFAQNPLIMDQHMQTLTDPIGHLSFFSFMIVNGYVTEFLNSGAMAMTSNTMGNRPITNELMKELAKNPNGRAALAAAMKTNDPLVREKLLDQIADEGVKVADRKSSLNPYSNSIAKKAYMKMVPYLGMTAGSMASHISGDFLRTLQTCVTSLYKDPKMLKEQGAGQAPTIKDRLNGLSQDPCDVAWREWVLEKKFNTYSPALVSMVLSTMGSGALTMLGGKAQQSGAYGSIKTAMGKGKQVVVGKLRLEGAEIVLSGLFGGAWGKLMKLVGHFTSITLFTALDTMIHSWVEDKVLNFNMGTAYLIANIDAFPRKGEILDTLLKKEGSEKFQKDTAACEKDLSGVDCRRNDIEGWLHDFSEAMIKWRDFNQTKAKQAHAQWVDKINKFQDMERFSKAFYERFIYDLKSANACRNNRGECEKIKSTEQTDAEILDGFEEEALFTKLDLLFLNYRQYPLYGVQPDPSTKLTQEKSWKNRYLDNPGDLQVAQQITVHKVAAQLEVYLNSKGLDSAELKGSKAKLLEIVAGLKSPDLYKNGVAINLMRTMTSASRSEVHEITQSILREFLNKMGYPAPLLYYGQGFPYAFETHESNKDLVKRVELPEFYRNMRLSTQFRFEKKTDYLFYYMLCGPNAEKSQDLADNTLADAYALGLLGFRDLFLPPRLVNDSLKLDVCSDRLNFASSGSLYSQWILDEAQNIKYPGAFSVIDKNLSDSMRSIVNSTKFDLDSNDKKNPTEVFKQPMFNMSVWWEKNVEPKVSKQLELFKTQYESIAVKFLEAQFKGIGNFVGIPLHSAVVKNSVVSAALQESRVYSLVLGEVFKKNLPAAELEKLYATDSQFENYAGYRKQTAPHEILSLQGLPYHQDLNAIKTGTAPKLFKFQLMNESILSELYYALKKAEIVNMPDLEGKERQVVDLKMDEKQIDALEKKIDESLQAMSQEIDTLATQIKVKETNGERAKPLRIAEFTKNQMNQIARELVATLSTIQFARNAALQYSLKGDTDEQKRLAEKAQRETQRKKCIQTKSAAGVTGGGGC